MVLQTCGQDFDCATRIIFAHPCKTISHIRKFREAGVQMTVVDNEDELRKLKEHWPEAKVNHMITIHLDAIFHRNRYSFV